VTFLKRGEEIRKLYSDTLPVGVIQELQLAVQTTQLEDGDFLIMVTDGVLDALPVQEQDFLMEGIIRGARTGNPTEMAHHILQQVLEWQGGEPRDDMLVLVTGIWEQMPA
jgi:stage II sporulation protein E